MYVTSAMDTWKEKQLKTYGKIDPTARQEHCAKKKGDWNAMSAEEKEPFEKIARDKHVRQAAVGGGMCHRGLAKEKRRELYAVVP